MTNKTSVFTSVPLTNVANGYKNDDYISELVAPIVNVQKDTGRIYSYAADNLRIVNTYRSEGSKPNIVDTTVSSAAHYVLEEHTLGEYISKEVIENAEKPIKPRIDVTEALVDRIWVDKEKALADVVTSTTSISTSNTTLSGTSQWSDYTNSDPIGDMRTAISAVKAASSKIPNTFIVAWNVMQTLLFHPDIVNQFPGATVITADMVASKIGAIFGLKKVLVGSAMYNNANKGASDSVAEIWDKDCLVAYIENSPTIKSQTLARTYTKGSRRQVELAGMNSGSLEQLQRKADYLQVTDKYDQVLVNEACAYLIEAAIA